MSGRGDNNKKGTSGQGASNQSNQGMSQQTGHKSSHGDQTGGQRSEPQHKKTDQTADRNKSQDKVD